MSFIAPKGILRFLKRLPFGRAAAVYAPIEHLSDAELCDIGLVVGRDPRPETYKDDAVWRNVGGPPRAL